MLDTTQRTYGECRRSNTLLSTNITTRSNNPPPPLHLFGRDEYVRKITDSISSKVSLGLGARLVIGGPGGIGKTSVALKIFYLPELDALIPPRARFFVPCQAVTTASTFLSAISSALGIEIAEDNPLESMLRRLRAERGPMMLVLDNAESFWMNSEVQPRARAYLRHVCNIDSVTLLITIRGTEQPDIATWDPLPLLGPLGIEDARNAFLAIANTVQPSASLDLLLKKVDCVPLAVNLLARRCQISGEDPIILSRRWEKERTRLLRLGDRNPEDNIDVSIKLSLDSELIRRNTAALRLLSIVSYLPAGISDEACNSLKFPDSDLSAAEFLLRRLSLTYSPAPGWLTTLEPVRAYVRQWHQPSSDDIRAVEEWHVTLATSHGNCRPGQADFLSASAILATNSANISFVLHARVRRRDNYNLASLADAVLAFSNFLYWTLPNADLLDSLLAVGRNELDVLLNGRCTQLLGNILLVRGQYEEAQSKLEEARLIYVEVNRPHDVAQCLHNLGDIARMRDQYEDAVSKLEQAQSKFTALSDRVGIAQCLRSLGYTLRMQGQYVEAQSRLKEAEREFIDIGEPLGAAQCLHSLGDISLAQGRYKDAQLQLEDARETFIGIGNRVGVAHCLHSLSGLSCKRGRYKDALSELGEAELEFRTLGNQHWDAQCLHSFALISLALGRYGDARSRLQKARAMFTCIGNLGGAAQCLHALSDISFRQGQYQDALSKLGEAQSQFTSIGNQHWAAQCLQSFAIISLTRGDHVAARLKLDESRSMFRSIGDQLGDAKCLQSLGNVLLAQGQYEGARSKLEEAESKFITIGHHLGATQCVKALGNILQIQGSCDAARSKLEEALSGFTDLDDRLGTALCLRDIGDILQAQGDYVGAQSRQEEAKTIFDALNLVATYDVRDDPRRYITTPRGHVRDHPVREVHG